MTDQTNEKTNSHTLHKASELSEVLYCVKWESKITIACGKGKPTNKGVAEAAVKRMNAEYPDIKYWMVVAI